MRKQFKVAIAVFLLVILGTVYSQVLRQREPTYQGKTLSSWLEGSFRNNNTVWSSTNGPVGAAIRHFGTNAIPLLIKMAGAKDSPFKHSLIIAARKQQLVEVHMHTDKECHSMAAFGFYVLGPLAKDAVSLLIKLLNNSDADIRVVAVYCLGNIGPAAKPAVPHLIGFLNDTKHLSRWDITWNLGRIHQEPALVVPILIKSLNPSNEIFSPTISALIEFGAEAKPAVPLLIKLLNDERDYVRMAATNALKKIDPEAAGSNHIRVVDVAR